MKIKVMATIAVALFAFVSTSADAKTRPIATPTYYSGPGWVADAPASVRVARHRHHKRHASKAKRVKLASIALPTTTDANANEALPITSCVVRRDCAWQRHKVLLPMGKTAAPLTAPELPALGALVTKAVEPSASPSSNPNAHLMSCPRGRYGGSTAIAGLHPVLKAKVQEITAACKTHVVSTYCRGGMTPNHGGGFAADLQGDPECIKSHMAGWKGGMSTDYYTAPGTKHYHISYSRKHEWGLRFAHYHGGKTRTAKRGFAHYAAAGNYQTTYSQPTSY